MRVFTVVDVRKAGTPEDLLGCKCGPGWPNCLVYLYFLLTELLFWKSKQFLKFTLFLVFILTTVHTSASKYLILFAFRQHEWPWLCMIDQVYSNQSTQKKNSSWSCARGHFWTSFNSRPDRQVQNYKIRTANFNTNNELKLLTCVNKVNSFIFFCLREKEIIWTECTHCTVLTVEASTFFWYSWLVRVRPSAQVAWNSSDCFESFSPLNNVWIDRPLMPSSDVTHYPKTE